jgi:hypothetical protein
LSLSVERQRNGFRCRHSKGPTTKTITTTKDFLRWMGTRRPFGAPGIAPKSKITIAAGGCGPYSVAVG